MSNVSVQLNPIKVPLERLFLDPNNPRFAKNLNLEDEVSDSDIAAVQQKLHGFFVNEQDSESGSDDDDWEAEEGAVRIGDLIRSMDEIGFVPIDRVVVRQLKDSPTEYVVIEGNRRVRAAKYVNERNPAGFDLERRRKHDQIVKTLKELDVLLLKTEGLSPEVVHDQIGVILGLRHFGQVLGWGMLAKAVNIYNEYMLTLPIKESFELESSRITLIKTRLSETRSGVISALKTYIAYKQMQEAFPYGQPKPAHYSLLQACVVNRKLGAAAFIGQDKSTYKLSASSLENLNASCEFEARDGLKEEEKILRDPKSVSRFAGLVADATGNRDGAVRAFAASLHSEVMAKERTLDDAVDNLRSFKNERVWTEALESLLEKVVESGSEANGSSDEAVKHQLLMSDFVAMGNDLLRLEEARKAFKNVRTILGI